MKKIKINPIASVFGIGLSMILSSASAASASSLNHGVTFNGLVMDDVNLPAIKIYKAELDIKSGDYNSAVRNYIEAVKDGQTSAAFNVANLVKQGKVSGSVLESSLAQLSALAVSNANISYFLGVYYKEISKKPDLNTSFKWFNNALSLGNIEAAPFVAEYVSSGLAIANQMYTHDNAASMLKLAADKGDFEAAFKLASMIYGDPKVVKNMGIALKYFTVAAKNSIGNSLYMIAYMNEYGIGCDKNVANATSEYKRVLETASQTKATKSDAANQLARIYMYGKGNVAQDRLKGILFLSKSAELGNIEANTKLGLLNLYGADDYKVNVDAAIKHLKTASQGGSKVAMNTLYQIYKNGLYGVPVNTDEAAKYNLMLLNL